MRYWVLAMTLLVLGGAAWAGAGVHDRLVMGDNLPVSTRSAQADRWLRAHAGAGKPDLVVVAEVTAGPAGAAAGGVDDVRAAAAGRRLTAALAADPGVSLARSYWAGGDRGLRSSDGRSAVAMAWLRGDLQDRLRTARRLVPRLPRHQGPLAVTVGGDSQVRVEAQKRSEHDLRVAELVALPLTLAVLLVVFGSLVAALIPLAMGAFCLVGAMALLRLLSEVTPVSVYALNIASLIGFALAVDFSLFIVTRFREELARQRPVPEAVRHAIATTGRAMGLSAVSVLAALAALLVIPSPIVRSIAYGGIAVTALAALAALAVLPAALAVLGAGVDRLAVPGPWSAGRRSGPGAAAQGSPFWARLARLVMRRPVAVTTAAGALLLLLAAPLLHVRFGIADERILPPQDPAARAGQLIRDRFDAQLLPLTVVLPHRAHPGDYPRRLSAVPGVVRVQAANGTFAGGRRIGAPDARSARYSVPAGTWMAATTAAAPFDHATAAVAERLRAVAAPERALVGGPGAELADTRRLVGGRLAWMLAIMALATIGVVMWMTGSPLLGLKALLLNALTLTSTFGVLVAVFQDGRLHRLVGEFTTTGTLDVIMPVVVLGVAFGVSMDYEMFLLARITEEYRRHGDTPAAVIAGLHRTGRLFTCAAAVFALVMAAMATSSVVLVKMVAVGVLTAVVVDATLVRALLVPGIMRLAGRANWWSPWRASPIARRPAAAPASAPTAAPAASAAPAIRTDTSL
ncbi:MMPL family transporter [Actinomadura sp. NAK00032]|uniref:MMPL family transporter n=1 Tax=Actinomadura sp. NAK00032 TaxID=2742128 RepID=UPI001591596C|nr:MMPL family transporter [Actinomadura sp. NAK00032]QKW38470.1 MMPL family transporter [Actinomadura sp. NAK00032]